MSSAFEGLPKTPNLKLNKPGYDNVADIEALNENADILDEEIQGIKNTFVKSVNGKEPDANGNVEVSTLDVSSIVDIIYPVGSLYWSKKSTDPATLFGGTWTQIKDKFILAAGDRYAQGATGGSASVTLTTAQLPAHNHSASTNSTGNHTHTRGNMEIVGDLKASLRYAIDGSVNPTGAFYKTGATGSYGDMGDYWYPVVGFQASKSWTGSTSSNGNHSHTVTVNNTGSGNSHENMPPFVAYYCWERTA